MAPLLRFLTPPPLPLARRRAWRLLRIANLLALPWALVWCVVLWRSGDAAGAGANLLLACAAAVALALQTRGRLLAASRLTLIVFLVFLVYNALWLSPPMPGVPRAAHQYLLALALASLLLTGDDRPWFRAGVPLIAIAVYVALAGSEFSMAAPPAMDAATYAAGSWVAHGVSMAVVLAVIHVLQSDVRLRAGAEVELRDAILRGELELHYQPQVDLEGRGTGVEALVRWRHPRRGLVQPSGFVPLAQACGLIVPLGEWVLRRSCVQLAAWAGQPGLGDLTMSVNVAAAQFEQPDFVPKLVEMLAQHGVAASRLTIELTEDVIAADLPTMAEKMRMLRAHGVQVALDDFGTGFSSLSLLRDLPLDQLKIDRSFVLGLGDATRDEAIVKTIISLGHTLELDVVAEGVETRAQFDILVGLGCRHFQGFLFAHPVPGETLAGKLAELSGMAPNATAPSQRRG